MQGPSSSQNKWLLRTGVGASVLAMGTGLAWSQSKQQAQVPEQSQVLEVEERLFFEASSSFGQSVVKEIAFGSQSSGSGSQSSGGHSSSHRLELVFKAQSDLGSWSQRLTDPDIDARERAFDELVAAARKNTSLRYTLGSWSVDQGAPELAWTARLALRELARLDRTLQLKWVRRPGVAPQAVVVNPVPPQAHVAQLPEVESSTNGLRGLAFDHLFPVEGGHQSSLYAPRRFELPYQAPTNLRKFHLQVHPEGVVLIVQDIDLRSGSGRQQIYAGESLEQVLNSHPSLRQLAPALAQIGPGALSSAQSRVALRLGSPEANRPREGAVTRHIPTLVLGVECTSITLEEAERRQLGPGVGLLIERRELGSVAEALELQRGDILVELLGQPLCTAEEISRILAENRGPTVTVKFVDRHGIERTRSWTPR